MFSDLKWMSFPERDIYKKVIHLFKTIRGDAPEYLRVSFTSQINLYLYICMHLSVCLGAFDGAMDLLHEHILKFVTIT